MAQQQGNGDLGGTFSKLNINAMEFVPSFRPRSAAPAPVEPVEVAAPIADVASGAAAAVAAPAPATANDTTSAEFIIIIPNRTMSSMASSGATTPNTDTASETGTTGSISAGASPVHTRAVVGAEAAGSGSTQDVSAKAEAAAAAVDDDVNLAVTHDVVAAASSEDSFVDADAAQSTEALADKSPENPESEPLDSWDNEDDPLSTPDDEEELDGENGNAVVVTKKKSPVAEECKSKKEHVNVVFIGHVDAGKSTIGGQIMSLTGMVDKRTLEKYEREAREKSRESWYLSWALDTNQEERDKGKTVEVGRAFFETEKKHFTILDAPGHKSFVPNMIGGAAQADLAVLVLSARKGEFETGFDRGGQTREHAMLAKTAGVKHLVVLINKMDDPTVLWEEARYNECKDKILPYLKKLGFNPAKDLTFMPVSGLGGLGILDQLSVACCPWYRGPAFIPFIDSLPSLNRKMEGPFIMPIVDKYKDMGTVVMGKVESGSVKKGQNLLVMPNRTAVSVDQLWSDDEEVTAVGPGENVKIKLKGIEEDDVSPGFVLCDSQNPITTGRKFDAQVVILEHKSIICAGYSAVMHIHCAAEEVNVNALICLVDKKTGEKSKTRPRFVKQDQVAIMRIECSGLICLEQFKLFPQMGRFTLRDENKTIAIGKVLKVIE